jgi:hypothetical protein
MVPDLCNNSRIVGGNHLLPIWRKWKCQYTQFQQLLAGLEAGSGPGTAGKERPDLPTMPSRKHDEACGSPTAAQACIGMCMHHHCERDSYAPPSQYRPERSRSQSTTGPSIIRAKKLMYQLAAQTADLHTHTLGNNLVRTRLALGRFPNVPTSQMHCCYAVRI